MQYSHPEILLSPEDLNGRLGDPNLRIFDATVHLVPAAKTGYKAVSGFEQYQSAHIPGAAFMDLIQAMSDTSSGLGFTLPNPADLAAAIGEVGIGPDHSVVVYSSGHTMWATRAWWLLRHAGHSDVAVLDGGLSRWQAENLPTETEVRRYSATTFSSQQPQAEFVTLETMRDLVASEAACTVNALNTAVYEGTGDMHYGRRGHIPGSISLPYDALLQKDGSFQPAAQLQQTLLDQGLLGDTPVVAYCGGGIAATVDAFACRLFGKSDVAVYDGSMSEWVRAEQPLTTGSAP